MTETFFAHQEQLLPASVQTCQGPSHNPDPFSLLGVLVRARSLARRYEVHQRQPPSRLRLALTVPNHIGRHPEQPKSQFLISTFHVSFNKTHKSFLGNVFGDVWISGESVGVP